MPLWSSRNQSLSSLGSAKGFKVKMSFRVLLNFLGSCFCLVWGLNIPCFLGKSSTDLRYFYITSVMFRVNINGLFLSMIILSLLDWANVYFYLFLLLFEITIFYWVGLKDCLVLSKPGHIFHFREELYWTTHSLTELFTQPNISVF